MGARTPEVGRQPNIDLRLYVAGAVLYVVALACFLMSGFPFALSASDAPLGIILTLVVAAQHRWKVNSRDAFRRGQESLDGLPLTFGAFFVSPAWLVMMMVLGAQLAWAFDTDYTNRARWLNGSGRALAGVWCAIVFWWIAPVGPLDSPEALLACIGMWAATETIKFGMVVVWVRARYSAWTSPLLAGRVGSIPNRSVPVMLGWLLAVSFAAAHWMLPIVFAAIAMVYYMLYHASRSASLGSMVSWLLGFFVRAGAAGEPEDVESALNDAFQRLAVLTTHGVAVVDENDTLSWTGDIAASVRKGISSGSQLEALAEQSPGPNPFSRGMLWSWPIDRARHSHMVATGVTGSRGVVDVTKTGGYLVESARLAIDTMGRRRDFEATAAAERERARTDSVTGLANQLGFVEQAEALLASLPDQHVVVLQTSPVGFQHTTDVLGAEAGDQLLVEFARRLERIARDTAAVHLVGRGAQDSFLLAAVGDQTQIDDLAARISTPIAFTEQWATSGDAWVGAASTDAARSIGADELVLRAHLAMERSEREGRPMTFGFNDVVRERRRVSVRLRLPSAIESGLVRPAFQPQIDLGTGRVVSCEVLARWSDGQLDVVTPSEFVEISEQSQQIELLTLSLLRQALGLHLAFPSGRAVPLSVNLSARSLGNSAFVESLVTLIADSGRLLADFTFEVAESTIAADGIASVLGIDHLRSLGARVSIDDFGTGHSTLSFLDQLPIDEIKIDRSLISTIGTFGVPNPVIRHLIGLCSDLGLEVVAEGIENGLQRDLSYELGCDRAQGFLFARPMTPIDTIEWINAHRPQPTNALSSAV